MKSPQETKTPPTIADSAKVRIELEFDMMTSQLVLRSKSPTVIVAALLRKAETAARTEIPEEKPGGPRRVFIEYDLAKGGDVSVQTDAADLIYTGMLVIAHSMMTQNQIMQRLQAMAAAPRIHRTT